MFTRSPFDTVIPQELVLARILYPEERRVPEQSGPDLLALLLARIVFRRRALPSYGETNIPPPNIDVLLLIVELFNVILPLFQMPPPSTLVFPTMLTLFTVAVPWLLIPPPRDPAE